MQNNKNSFLTKTELENLPFKQIGNHVLISRKASFYNMEEISIGNNVRIDDFSLLSGKITIGSNVHISAYCALYGKFGIELKDHTGLSPRCTIISASDDFSGEYLIGPTNDPQMTKISGGKVIIEKFAQLGVNTVILPDLTIKEGTVTGAMTLVNKSLDSWGVYTGIPAKKLKNRSKHLLNKI